MERYGSGISPMPHLKGLLMLGRKKDLEISGLNIGKWEDSKNFTKSLAGKKACKMGFIRSNTDFGSPRQELRKLCNNVSQTNPYAIGEFHSPTLDISLHSDDHRHFRLHTGAQKDN